MTAEEIKAMLADFSASLKAELTPLREDISTLKTKVNAPPPAPPAPPLPEPPPAPEPVAIKSLTPEENAAMLEMKRAAAQATRDIADLKAAAQKATEEAAKARKDSAVSTAISELKFANPQAREVALGLFNGQLREEGGRYIAGDNLTPEAHAKTFFGEQHSYLLATNGATGGTGITSTSTNPQGGGRIATTEMIKYGMSEEDKTLVRQQIAAVAKQQLS